MALSSSRQFLLLVSLFYLFSKRYAAASEHCPALSLNFEDFGITFCKPTYSAPTLKEAEHLFEKEAKCMGYNQWTLDSSHGCSSPVATQGMEFEFPCFCYFGGECKLHCLEGYRLHGKNTIICQNNGSWSFLSSCLKKQCKTPELPPLVKILGNCDFAEGVECHLSCTEVDARMDGDNTIRCNNEIWSPPHFPECHKFCKMEEIPKELKTSNRSCSNGILERCSVSCENLKHTLNGPGFINCTENAVWSKLPTCGCSRTLPTGIAANPDCTYEAGKSCPSTCAKSYYLKGDNNLLLCDEQGEYDLKSSIQCLPMCPEATLPPTLEVIGSCDAKRGEVCKVKCSNSQTMRLSGSDTFHCLPDGEYSIMPACAEVGKCPQWIPSHLEFVDECLYVVGSACTIRCVEKHAELVGSATLTCQSSGNWSPLPKCFVYCPEYKLPSNASFVEEPTGRVKAGDRIMITCPTQHYPSVEIEVLCSKQGRYSYITEFNGICEKMCPTTFFYQPDQRLVDCHGIEAKVGAYCVLSCVNKNSVILPSNRITCIPGPQWSEIPYCFSKCSTHNIHPKLKVAKSCEQLLSGITCLLECIEPEDTLIGEKEVSCSLKGNVVIAKSTACVKPCKYLQIPPTLVAASPCKDKLPGEKCELKCKNSLASMKGDATVSCTPNGVFTDLPKCELHCLPTLLKSDSHIVGSCHRDEGSECKIACNHPKHTIDGKKEAIIKCINTEWTKVKDCESYCDEPEISTSVVLRQPCSFRPFQSCTVMCKDSEATMIGSPILMCLGENKWETNNPKCEKRCRHPHFPEHMDWKEPDTCNMRVGDSCMVECFDGYVVTGRAEITCQSSSTWTPIDSCVKQCPEMKWPITFENGCFRYGDNSICKAKCTPPYTLEHNAMVNIRCQVDGTWDKIPKCVTKQCALPPYLVPIATCSFEPLSMCRVKCRNPDEILYEDNNLLCSNFLEYVYLPRCYPRDPDCEAFDFASVPFEPESHCEPQYTLYYKCYVKCPMGLVLVGPNFIMCEPGGKWSFGPKCAETCHIASLPSFLNPIEGLCSAVENTFCSVYCKRRDYAVDPSSAALCVRGTEWIFLPSCIPGPYGSCSYEDLPPWLKPVQSTNVNIIGVECLDDNLEIKGPNSIACKTNNQWTQFPVCERPEITTVQCEKCPWTDCDRTNFGESCSYRDMTCPELRTKMSYCLSNGQWSNPPCDYTSPDHSVHGR